MTKKEYCIAFAKLSLTKEDGIEFYGTFFGGLTGSEQEANNIAMEFINNTKGCTILAQIIPLKEDDFLLEVLDEAHEKFSMKLKYMKEAYDILSKPTRKRKK
jgi:hypothetical protein